MTAKAKKVVSIIVFALLIVLLLFDSFVLYFLWTDYKIRAEEPLIDSNIMELEARVNCLEHGEVWDDLVAEFEKMNSEISIETAEAQ